MGNEVKRYDCTSGGASFCQGCYTMEESEYGDYVEASDYDALRAEAEALRAENGRLQHALDVKEEFYQDALHSHIVLAQQRDQLRAELEALRSQHAERQEAVAAQHRFRHPQKTAPSWSPWQPAEVNDKRPAWTIDSQGYEVEYRLLYTSTPPAQDVSGLVAFALELIDGAWEGGSFDGGDIQEAGVRHRLLVVEQRQESCGEHCDCAEYGFPSECYRLTPALAAYRKAQP